MEMGHECRVTYVLWVIWDVDFGDGYYFLFDMKKGKSQTKLS